jgi:hypothetical protein
MDSDRNFAPSLSSFLALHTNQSAEYLNYLIDLFMQGATPCAYPEPSVKQEIAHRIAARRLA